jgi:hypothetical protein
VTDLWSDKEARDNAAGGTREHRAIPQVPPKTGRTGPATVFRVPASGSGKEASPLLLVFRSLQQELGTRKKLLPLRNK